ncbi:MAG: helix-turn-helix transcriptional regulator [Ignavibacteriaceae bacterium]|nr:helix-turn-helix transcriptional regulator [Ignavibacteriaceae bacterium]
MSTIQEKLNKVASKKSDWLEKAEWEIANEDWLNKSAKIAIKILRTIRAKNITQLQLAEMLNVSPQQISKIVKGQENLTLETIAKLEKALDIKLVEIPAIQTTVQLDPKLYVSIISKYTQSLIVNKNFNIPLDESNSCPEEAKYSDLKLISNG